MFGSFVLAVGSIAATLLPFPAVLRPAETVVRSAAQAHPLRLDRLSITKRIIEARSRVKAAKIVFRPSVLPQAFHYRSIHMVKCSADCYASDINNRGQIAITYDASRPPAVIDNSGEDALSPLLSDDRPYSYAEAVALNDFGGVTGNYNRVGFKGNLTWQLQDGVYKGLYFDGRDYGARANAINGYDVTVGTSGTANAYPVQASLFSQFMARRPLLGLNEKPCSDVQSGATGINDAATIVGYQESCEGNQAVRFSTFGYAKAILPQSVFPESSAAAINQLGDVVGFCTGFLGEESFLYLAASDRAEHIPHPAGESIGNFYAFGLNSSDQVVGDTEDPDIPFYAAWLYTGGVTYDLNAILPKNSRWTINTAIAINDAGQIVGSGDYTDPATGVVHENAVFVMTP